MEKGRYNKISDVTGVLVGHRTVEEGDVHTGVTVILPRPQIFRHKCPAAVHVINGFGKTSGLLQIEEMGVLESPIALTNTLSVGVVQQALVRHMLAENKEIGTLTGTVNVVVGECNDSYLNDIRACRVQEADVFSAIADARADFALGSVGAGRGMSCFEMKGGIGSASRIIPIGNQRYTLGALVLTNFGRKQDFLKGGSAFSAPEQSAPEQGSILMILASDLPLSSRQLKRLCRRTPAALARVGSWLGNGSGDIAIAFSTGNEVSHFSSAAIQTMRVLNENYIDLAFRAAIEACEEAILSSLHASETLIGKDGHVRYSLKDTLAQMKKSNENT